VWQVKDSKLGRYQPTDLQTVELNVVRDKRNAKASTRIDVEAYSEDHLR